MAAKMWFGIPNKKMQWVPCPLIDSTISRRRYVERIQFENGGGDAKRSPQYQMEYHLNFNDLAHEVEGIDAFNKYASGFYGDGLIYLAHPANFETNMFSAQWATPELINNGWTNITVNPVDFSTPITANSYNQPQHFANFNLGALAANTYYRKFTIAIPPTHTLYMGVSGFTGYPDASVRVRPIKADGTYDTPVDLVLLDTYDSTRMNTTFSGSSYVAVDVYLTNKTGASYAPISISSMMAQLYVTGSNPTLPSKHYTGEGSTGLMFVDDAIVENYSYLYPPRKGLSTTLVEVEAWR